MKVPQISLHPAVANVLLALLVVALAYAAAKFSGFVFEALSRRLPARRLFFKRLQPFPQLGAYVIAGYLVIHLVGPDRTSLYAMLASVALALGLAAQDLVKDLLGGIVILIDTPFQIGDRIKVGEYYGDVRNIGLRSTKLLTLDEVLVTVPNSKVLSASIANANAGAVDCLITTHVYLRANADLEQIGEIARAAVLTSKGTQLGKPIQVLFTSRQAEDQDVVDLEIRSFVFDVSYESKYIADLTHRIKNTMRERGLLDEGPEPEIGQHVQSEFADMIIDLGRKFASAPRARDPTG